MIKVISKKTKKQVKKRGFLKGIKEKVSKTRKLNDAMAALIKFEENPIISPIRENEWESWQTFNPGAILFEDRVHFLYRAIGSDGISRLGHASSGNGFKFDNRFSYPVYEHRLSGFSFFYSSSGGSFGGCEARRMRGVGNEDILYMTYTACDGGLGVALTSIALDDFLSERWKWKTPVLISPPGEIHKNWVIFPEKLNGQYAILHSVCPEISIEYLDNLEFAGGQYIYSRYQNTARNKCWDSWIRGAGPPPIKTEYGWLLFYHAIDNSDPGRYKVGAMLLDLDDPAKILYRSPEPILEPDEFYENQGFKAGIVYATGAVVKNGELLVYYGGADSFVCVASAVLEEFLQELKKESKPRLQKRMLKTKK